jgi:hypothetical protein
MSYIHPFTIGAITYVDSRGPMDPAVRTSASQAFNRFVDQNSNEGAARNNLDLAPGYCGTLQLDTVQLEYFEAFNAGETEETFEQWHAEALSQVPQGVFYVNEGFIVYAFDGDTPVGGIPVIDVVLDGTSESGELLYNAVIPPVLSEPHYAAEMFEHITASALAAEDDEEVLVDVRLTKIRFPDDDTRNRLLLDDDQVQQWIAPLEESQVTWKQADGQTYLVEMRPLVDA